MGTYFTRARDKFYGKEMQYVHAACSLAEKNTRNGLPSRKNSGTIYSMLRFLSNTWTTDPWRTLSHLS